MKVENKSEKNNNLPGESKGAAASVPINNEKPPNHEEAEPSTSGQPESRSCLVPSLAEVKMEQVKWLLEHYIEANSLSIVAGRGGVGKGLFSDWLAARTTSGCSLGDYSGPMPEMGEVLFFSAEDNPSTKLAPCACAAGAKMDKVRYMTPGLYRKMTKGRTLEIGPEMCGIIDLVKPKVVIIDPVQSVLPGDMSITSPKVRRVLEALAEKAESDGFSVILVLHQNKSKSKDPRVALAGNNDLWNLARSVVAVGTVPGNEDLFYVSSEKLNDAVRGETMIFRKEEVIVNTAEGDPIKTVAAVFDSFSDKRYADFEAGKTMQVSQARAAVKTAIMLALGKNQRDGVASTELQETVTEATDCSETSYVRARNELKAEDAIEKYKDGHGGWSWRIREIPSCA